MKNDRLCIVCKRPNADPRNDRCPYCQRGYKKISQYEFCRDRYAKGNKKLAEELDSAPLIQHAQMLAEYVKNDAFLGEHNFAGIVIWEALSANYQPFEDKWTAAQFIEFFKSDVPVKRYGEHAAVKKISDYQKRIRAERKE